MAYQNLYDFNDIYRPLTKNGNNIYSSTEYAKNKNISCILL